MTAKYDLQACRVATLPVPGWECFFGCNDMDFYPLAFYVWIVKGEGHVGLIDTGLPVDVEERQCLIDGCQRVDPRSTFTDIVTLDRLYQEWGLSPVTIDFVLLTQTITYHSGGLHAHFFPHADVYISQAGVMEFLTEAPGHPPRNLYFTESSWSSLHKLLVNQQLHLIEGRTRVLPDLFFEATGGHHPGSAGIQVNTTRGTVGILETAFLKRNVDETLPIGIAENAALCRKVIQRYKQECDLVLADHDPTIMERFPEGTIR